MYHERQTGNLCAIHALNNIIQRKEFNEEYFDQVANQINILGKTFDIEDGEEEGGDYNISTIIAALQNRNFSIDQASEIVIERAVQQNTLEPGRYLIGNGYHWIGLRRFSKNGLLWNFDSLLPEPIEVTSLEDILSKRNKRGQRVGEWNNLYRITDNNENQNESQVSSSSIVSHLLPPSKKVIIF